MKRHELIRQRYLLDTTPAERQDISWLYQRATELAFALRCMLHDVPTTCDSCKQMAQALIARWDAEHDQPTLPQLDVCPNGEQPTSGSCVVEGSMTDW